MHGTQWAQVTVSKHIVGGMQIEDCVQGCGWQLDQSEFSFPVLVSPVNAKEKRPLLAGKKATSKA